LYLLRPSEKFPKNGVREVYASRTPFFGLLEGPAYMKANTSPVTPFAIGIEIGGTKIQVGIGSTNGKVISGGLIQKQVVRERGADGIRHALLSMVKEILDAKNLELADIARIGIGFGGILDINSGVILKSYQIDGWDDFALRKWAGERWNKPVFIQNDASVAGLAESLYGSGQGYTRVFYMTIGSGIGGGWITDGKVDNGQGLGAAEIGHTWVPDPGTGEPSELEQICSGWSIGRRAREIATKKSTVMTELAGTIDEIDAKIVYSAAKKGDEAANLILVETCQTLGLAISNVIALLHPECVILGGGVSLMGSLFWNRLRAEVRSRTIPALASKVRIVRAKLKENVVIIGALSLC
jgi:glucokinase